MVSLYRRLLLCCLSSLSLCVVVSHAAEPAPSSRDVSKSRASGREIFQREWIANDPRSHGGDGLGPVFNESSCVSCHNQGGVGGGGPESKNVIVISAVAGPGASHRQPVSVPQAAAATAVPRFAPQPAESKGVPQATPVAPATPPPVATPAPTSDESPDVQMRKRLLEDLRQLHPGLVTSRSVVLHKSGTDRKYSDWRDRVLGLSNVRMQFNQPVPVPFVAPKQPVGGFFASLVTETQQQAVHEMIPPAELQAEKARGLVLNPVFGAFGRPQILQPTDGMASSVVAIPTQRNSTALFGVGLIDSIPDSVLEAAASQKFADFPEVTGRVARLKDGRIGRFGWKAQKANLYDFTMTACAVELGLNVPDHPQAGVPLRPDYVPAGFDLNREECLDLVQFLRDLPAPTQAGATAIASEIKQGEAMFARIGCAACHTENLGEVNKIYSDLLVHDMGSDLGDSGSYGVFQPQSSGSDAEDPLGGLLTESSRSLGVSGTPFGVGENPSLAFMRLEQLPEKMIGAGRQEWRTAPLWGVRDSAPYMHDGRAGSLEQAIAFHGGEAQLAANRFFRLRPEYRTSLLTFLRSLQAPDAVASVTR